MRPKLKTAILPFLLFLLFLQNASAQSYPIQVTIIAPPPYPYLISDYLTRTGETVLILTNTDPFNNYKTKIGVYAEGDNGLKIISNWEKNPIEPITLAPLESRIFTADEILDLYSNHTPDDITFKGIEINELVQSQTLPEGIYTACVQILDFNTNEYLSMPQPGGCTPPIPILGLDPPIIVSPQDGGGVEMQQPQLIPFQWTAVAGAQTMIHYRFRLIQLFGGVNPYDAMESDNFLIYEEEDILAPIKIYDSALPLLEQGVQYAVQVTAYDPTNTTLIRNEGKSEIITFKHKKRKYLRPGFVNPLANAEINTTNAAFINFAWTMTDAPSANYHFRLFEKPEGMSSYAVYAAGDTYLVYEETDLIAPNLPFDLNTNPLDLNKAYTAFVTASDPFGFYYFQGQGRSYPRTFSITNGLIENNDSDELTDDEIVVNIPPIDDPINEPVTPAIGNFDCGMGCEANVPTNTVPVTTAGNGNTLRIGNFLLQIDQATWAGNQLSGQARILSTDLMPVNLRCNLNNVQVNAQNEIFDGTVTVAANQDFLQVDWINEDALFIPEWNGSFDQFTNDIETFVENIDDVIDPQATTGISLPVQIVSNDMVVVITGITFTPEGANYNLISYTAIPGDIEQGNRLLVFTGENICYSPSGLVGGTNDTQFSLAKDIEFKPSEHYSLQFLKGTNNTTGTFARFDCDGFLDVTVDGLVVFDRELIIPTNENRQGFGTNGKMAGYFNTIITTWDDWVVSLDFSQEPASLANNLFVTPYFQLNTLPDFIFRAEDVVMDFALGQNAPNMIFPADYPNDGADWQGVYFKNLELQFPYWVSNTSLVDAGSIEKVGVGLSNFLIDTEGFTGRAAVDDVLQLVDGAKDVFDFSIEDFSLNFFQNNLTGSTMSGQVKMPFFDSAIGYNTGLNYNPSEDRIEYDFTLDANERYEIPMWYADAEITGTNLEITGGGEDYEVELQLDGTLNFDSDALGLDLENIGFEGLTFIYGENGFEFALPEVDLQGNPGGSYLDFDISLNDLRLENGFHSLGDLATLALDMNLELGGEGQGITIENMLLNIDGLIKISPTISYEPYAINLEEINIHADVAGVTMDGNLTTYTNNGVFGNGFSGSLEVDLAGVADGNFAAKFGKAGSTSNRYSYWYVNGNINPNSPIPFVSPMDIYGFGGGAYYHINKSNLRPTSANIFGIRASVKLGMSPDPMMFNGDFELSAEFNTGGSGISLNTIGLSGNAKVLQEPQDNGAAPLMLEGDITYNHTISQLSANLNFELQIPASSPLFTGDGNFNFLYNPNQWYLHLGHPQDMVNVNFSPTLEVFGKSVTPANVSFRSYFVTGGGNGYSLPNMPSFPSQLSSYVRNRVSNTRPGNLGGMGFVMGLHTDFDFSFTKNVDLWLTTVGVYFGLEAGGGADISLRNTSVPCNGSPSYGINNWYATGQGYLYVNGEAGVTVAGKNYGVGIGVSAAGTFGLPDPTGLNAALSINVELGPVEISFNANTSMGEICNFSEEDLQDAIVRNIRMFRSCSIQDGQEVASLRWRDINPEFELHFNQSLTFGDETYQIWIEEDDAKLYRKAASLRLVQGVRASWNSADKRYKVVNERNQDLFLEEDTEYQLRLKASLIRLLPLDMNSDEIPFEIVEIDGNSITETFIVNFKTQEYSDEITTPIELRPTNRQRYFHKSDSNYGTIRFDNPYLLDDFNMRTRKIVARFKRLSDNVEHQVDVNFNAGSNGRASSFSYSTSSLEADRKYKVSFILVPKMNPNVTSHTFYEYYFGTSKFDTFQAKLSDMTASTAETFTEFSPYAGFDCDSYLVEIHGEEGFEEVELKRLIRGMRGTLAINDWDDYRKLLERKYAFVANGDLPVEELFLAPLNNLLQSPLTDGDIFGGSNSTNFNISTLDLGGLTGITTNYDNSSGPSYGDLGIAVDLPTGIDPTVLRLHWNVNEYTALMRHAILNPGAAGLPPLVWTELVTIANPFQPAPPGDYSLLFIAVDYPSFNKSYSVTIPD
ncbi:MAG: hypothetical protein ACI85O_000402 [Saprospiraceae bacterium]|jgi:hypothetical protein